MITLHKAKTENVFEIKKLLHETWICIYSEIYSPEAIEIITSEWHAPDLLSQQIQNPDVSFIIAKDEEKIVGMCNALLTHQGKKINIQRLHVSPPYQRQGIGSKLIKEALKEFPKASKVDLEVEGQNYRALAFYQKHGFRKVGEKVFEVKGIRMPCTIMEKTI